LKKNQYQEVEEKSVYNTYTNPQPVIEYGSNAAANLVKKH
jgi:hypothetical protein